MTECSNHIRYYHFMAGVLSCQQKDPLCSTCKAFSNSVRAVKDGIAEFESSSGASLNREERNALAAAAEVISSLATIPDAEGQKKAGRCRMPEGVCFVKSSKKLTDGINRV
jgi:hypothetical protein